MPHIPELIPKHHQFRILFGQKPLTRFKDYRNSIKVDLIKHDDKEEMMKGTYDFVKATWSEDGMESSRASHEEMEHALDQMFGGKALGLGLETINFIFRISGITRIDTHQIVRQRIGVTFSQQCTGDRFLSHNDALVEECIAQDPMLLQGFIDATLATKMSYAQMNDSFKVSIQAARTITPHNLETFIFMKIDLSTLLFFYKKRIDDGSQTWEINEIARKMQEAVCAVFPEMESIFAKMKGSFDFQKKASADRTNLLSTNLYIPKDDEFDYHHRDFLYPMKKEQMNFTNTPIKDLFYWGTTQVTEDQFNAIKTLYDKHDADVKANHYSNEEIKERAEAINEHFTQFLAAYNS